MESEIMTVIDIGEIIHVITRRNFEGDLRRHFVGTVQAVNGSWFSRMVLPLNWTLTSLTRGVR